MQLAGRIGLDRLQQLERLKTEDLRRHGVTAYDADYASMLDAVCIHVCMHACVRACVCARVRACVRVHVCVCVYIVSRHKTPTRTRCTHSRPVSHDWVAGG